MKILSIQPQINANLNNKTKGVNNYQSPVYSLDSTAFEGKEKAGGWFLNLIGKIWTPKVEKAVVPVKTQVVKNSEPSAYSILKKHGYKPSKSVSALLNDLGTGIVNKEIEVRGINGWETLLKEVTDVLFDTKKNKSVNLIREFVHLNKAVVSVGFSNPGDHRIIDKVALKSKKEQETFNKLIKLVEAVKIKQGLIKKENELRAALAVSPEKIALVDKEIELAEKFFKK